MARGRELAADKGRRSAGRDTPRQIITFLEKVDDGIDQADVQVDVRIARHEARPKRRQMQNAERERRVHPQPSARLQGRGRRDRLGLRHILENGERLIVERLAGLGQRQAPGGAVEQPRAEGLLQLVDITGDIGRRGLQLVRREAELAGLVAEIKGSGGSAVSLAGDVRSEDYAKALVALAVKTYGRLDVAFNNAGTLGEAGASTGVSEAGWSDAIAINLTGSFLGAKHQIAEMVKHGGRSGIFTSTFLGHPFPFPRAAAHATRKSR